MFHLHHSNRMERLADALAGLLETPLPDPFQPEVVVVQHPGLARWLEIALAERLGICANVRFPLPARFVWETARAWLGPDAVPEHDPLDREALAFRVYGLLPAVLEEAAFAPLRDWLAPGAAQGAGPGALRRWRLADRLADVLDRYQIYRPDLIEAWERGEEPDAWDARLWRRLRDAAGPGRVNLLRAFLEALAREPQRGLSALPPRVAVFGISSLPPAYLAVLRALGRVLDVHVFFHDPAREWWGDVVPERVRARIAARDPARAAYYEVGNRLLASLGAQGRDFLVLLYEGEGPDEQHFHHEEPAAGPGAPLLHRVQSDVLALRDGPPEAAWRPVAREDLSLRVHVCHGPMRECQVLHDQLLELFETLPGLEPRDVVVMAPDMERYAPFVDAVFGPQGRIPYAIADRPSVCHPLAHWLLDLLMLPQGRLALSEVVTLLEAPAVLRRLGLCAEDVEPAIGWLQRHGVRWAEDAQDRAAAGLPAEHLHTWAYGRERLLLGYALPDSDGLYGEVAPGEGVEGDQADRLGRIWLFVERLAAWRRTLGQARPVREWESLLGEALDGFLAPAPGEEEAAVLAIRDVLAAVSEAAGRAGLDEPVPVEVYRAWLATRLAEPGTGERFLGGAVTFCRLAPMRSIPFRVVYLLGMQDADFPRRLRRPDLDRMREGRRRGDRSPRDDDRYLFLEALLSARDAFHVSYVGRDPRDDTEREPSVVVSELLAYVDRHYRDAAEPERPAGALLVRRHPLHPFSPDCFLPGTSRGLWSYDAFWAEVAAASRRKEGAAAQEPAPLPPPPDPPDELGLERLERFLASPPRAFLEARLGVRMERIEAPAPEDDEPLALDPLVAYRIRERMLALRLRGIPPEEVRRRLEAEGRFPPGALGRAVARPVEDDIDRLWPRLEPWLGPPAEPLRVVVDLVLPARDDGEARLRLAGVLAGRIQGRGLLRSRPGNLRARDVLGLWVSHLALCAMEGEAAGESVFVARDRFCRMPPMGRDEARGHLSALAALHREGLARPLPLPVEALWPAFRDAGGSMPPPQGQARARKAFLSDGGGRAAPGEAHDPAFRRAFGEGVATLLERSEPWRLGEALFGPLLAHVHVSKGRG